MAMSKENSRFMECIGYLLKNGIVKSNREVASAIDVSPSTLTDISKGRIQASPAILRKLSELYGFKFSYLIGSTDIFMVEEPKVEYRSIDESITLPREAYQAMIYKIKDLEKKLSSYTLRHTYASWLLNKGVPITSLKELMGHTQINTTMVYAKLVRETIRKDLLKAFDGSL